jgi:hypothetical protein
VEKTSHAATTVSMLRRVLLRRWVCVECNMGKGKEIRLVVSVEEARFSWDFGVFGGLVRMHEHQACEIPLLWGTSPPVRR